MFTCFPQLPSELRMRIWRYSACVDPKNILLEAKSTHYHDASTDKPIFIKPNDVVPDSAKIFVSYRASSNALSPPALLHVSREARTIALEFYRPEESTKRFHGSFNTPHHGSYERCVWVNWVTDTLLLERDREASGENEIRYQLVSHHISKVARQLPKHSLQVAFSADFADHEWFARSPILELIKTVIIYGKENPSSSPSWDRNFILAPFEASLDGVVLLIPPFERAGEMREYVLSGVTRVKNRLISEFDQLPADAKGETAGSKVRDMQLMFLKVEPSYS
ncbi:hypothetical protein HYFRA_00002571 [Hymenoscyphus fraxineus]|uniref:2EXR domain-containing protein n=1 Tax=Hymenoscyphus fraxineus TaxID=746836 RepID=A0A9N9L6H3_9HELO|nr:hypothetical protein HYFRA_00002571 [Hymenoscyphus fraxineus]